MRWPASLAMLREGRSMLARMAMMAMTTNSSIKVKAAPAAAPLFFGYVAVSCIMSDQASAQSKSNNRPRNCVIFNRDEQENSLADLHGAGAGRRIPSLFYRLAQGEWNSHFLGQIHPVHHARG